MRWWRGTTTARAAWAGWLHVQCRVLPGSQVQHMLQCQGLERSDYRLGPGWGAWGCQDGHFCKPVWCHPEVSVEAVGNLAHCVCRAAERGCHVAPPATWHPGTPPLPPTRGWCEKNRGDNLGMVCNVGAGQGMVQQGGPATQVAYSKAMAGVYGVALTTQGSPHTWVATTKGTSSASMWPGQLASHEQLAQGGMWGSLVCQEFRACGGWLGWAHRAVCKGGFDGLATGPHLGPCKHAPWHHTCIPSLALVF